MITKIVFILHLISFNQIVFAQQATLTIRGTIPNVLNGRVLLIKPYFNPFSNFNLNIEPQETLIIDGKFSFSFLSNNLERYEIVLKNSLKKNSANFILEPKETIINFTDTILKNNIVKGNEMNVFYKNLDHITSSSKYSYYETRDTMRKIINANPNALINSYLISYFYSINNTKIQDDEFLRLWNLMPDSLTNNSLGNTNRFIANHLMVGTKFPEFSLPDTTGKIVKSAKFKGKYLLVEFWASWCIPCRKETPGLLKVYEMYKKRKFDVLNISVDTKKELWVNAIKEDNTTMWHNLSDLITIPDSPVTHKIFGLTSIPHNYLLSPVGFIIAKDIWGKDLEEFLRKLKL